MYIQALIITLATKEIECGGKVFSQRGTAADLLLKDPSRSHRSGNTMIWRMIDVRARSETYENDELIRQFYDAVEDSVMEDPNIGMVKSKSK